MKTRRAIAHVQNGTATVRCATTYRAGSLSFEQKTSKPDGWYRVRCYFERGRHHAEIGGKINPARESARLIELGKGHAYARTFSPGIQGFQQRENASREAAHAKIDESGSLGEMLRRWAEIPTETPAEEYGRKWARGIDCAALIAMGPEELRKVLAAAARDGWTSSDEARARR